MKSSPFKEVKTITIDDKDFKIGDIVTAYYAGYYKITKLYQHSYKLLNKGPNVSCPQVELEQIFTENFKKRSGKKNCALSYCEKVSIGKLQFEKEEELSKVAEGYNKVIGYLQDNKK